MDFTATGWGLCCGGTVGGAGSMRKNMTSAIDGSSGRVGLAGEWHR